MYGQEFARYGKTANPNGGVVAKTLVLYLTKRYIKGVVYRSGIPNWKKKENILSITHYRRDSLVYQPNRKELNAIAEEAGFFPTPLWSLA